MIRAGWVALGAAGFVLTFYLIHIPDGPEHWSADLRTSLLSPQQKTQRADIVLLYITDDTLQPYPYVAPIDRGLLANLIRAVDGAGAKAIGLDFIFDRATEKAKDDKLDAAIREARAPVVLGALDERSSRFSKAYQADFIARSHRSVGHLYFEEHRNPLIVSDHVVRSIALPSEIQSYEKCFAEAVASAAGSPSKLVSPHISWLLPPADGTETFMSLSAEHVLGTDRISEALPLQQLLGGKIVLIGGNFPDRDQHLTPLSVADGVRYPGLFIHAQVLAQLLDKRFLYSQSTLTEVTIVLLAIAIGFWIGRLDVSGHNHLLIESMSTLGLVALSIGFFLFFHLIFPFTTVFIGGMAGVMGGHYSRGEHG